MSTRNRLHEFLVDDACALACSGMLWKCEKTVDTVFFTPDVCAAGRLQTSCDRIGETRSGISPRVAALASGMVERVKMKETRSTGMMQIMKPVLRVFE